MFQATLFTTDPPWLTDALRLLASHRFLSVRQLAGALAHDRAEVEATCTKLAGEGALHTLHGSTLVGRNGGAVAFALTSTGLARIDADPGALRPRVTRSLRSAVSVAHELQVNEVGLTLELLAKRGLIKLLSWTTARERLADCAFVKEQGRAVRVPLVADALAIVEVQGTRHALLIEADLGTVAVKTMALKYRGYVSWWTDGGHVRRLGLPATRVVTVAPAPRRLERLRGAAIAALDDHGSGLLWFLPDDAVDVDDPERLFAPLAFVGRDGEDKPRSLFVT